MQRVDVRDALQMMVDQSNQTATVEFNKDAAVKLLAGKGSAQSSTLVVIYSYGDFTAASKVVRSDDAGAKIEINRVGCLPPNKVAAFFQNPFSDLEKSKTAPLVINNALITPVPPESTGWLTAICTFCFMAFSRWGRASASGCTVGTDAHAHSFQRHEHRAADHQAVSSTIAVIFLPSVGSTATQRCSSSSPAARWFISSPPRSSCRKPKARR